MPSRTTTNYTGHAMTEIEIKQANKTTMFVLGGLRRPKEAWIVAAQAQKEIEDAREKNANKRKIPAPTEAPIAKRCRKSVLSQEEKDRKLQEQRSRYNQKRREARAELRKKKQHTLERTVSDKQPKTSRLSTERGETEEILTTYRKKLKQGVSIRHQLQENPPVDIIDDTGENDCTDEELADLIAAELDDVSDNEEQTSTKDDCKEDDAKRINSEVEGGRLDSAQENVASNEQTYSSTSELHRDVVDESSEESEEE